MVLKSETSWLRSLLVIFGLIQEARSLADHCDIWTFSSGH